jgi:hypothetical protein
VTGGSARQLMIQPEPIPYAIAAARRTIDLLEAGNGWTIAALAGPPT